MSEEKIDDAWIAVLSAAFDIDAEKIIPPIKLEKITFIENQKDGLIALAYSGEGKAGILTFPASMIRGLVNHLMIYAPERSEGVIQ